MWLYYVLKTISNIISALPYKFVVRLGRGCGKLYWYIAKKQRIRAEETMQEHLGISAEEAQKHGNFNGILCQCTHSSFWYGKNKNRDSNFK